jgi:membrane protein CcdC involved in cytochrome C biogenesis
VHPGFGISAVIAIVGLLGVLAWRVREARTAVTVKKIIIPPLGMATGFSMFVVPAFRVPWSWAAIAFLIGMVALAYPLLITSRLVRDGDAIMMRRSNAFFIVVIALAAIRFFARDYLDAYMSMEQTAGLFFVLAFGMILRWRMRMLFEYRTLSAQLSA